MRIGPLPDALKAAFAESRRPGSGVSQRQNALDPGFHDVPAGPAHPDRDADGAGVI